MQKIKGGYVLKARCIKDSWIAHAPPVIRETWDYLLREANHTEGQSNGYPIKRGQLFRSYREIRDALSWNVGYRKKTYSEAQMKHSMKVLRRELMIQLTSKPRGNLITICNYDFYQEKYNYVTTNESTNESTNKLPTSYRTCLPINKKKKNERMKEEIKETLVSNINNI